MGGHHARDHAKWPENKKKYREAQATQAQHDKAEDEEEEEEEEEQEPSDVEPDPWEEGPMQENYSTTGGDHQDHENFFGPWAGFACEWNEV